MAIKQQITYYSNYKTKTFTEYVSGEITVYQEFDKNGNVTLLLYPQENEWHKWEHNEHGDVLYHEDHTGYWMKQRFDKNGYPTYRENSWDGIILCIKRGIGTPNKLYEPNPRKELVDGN